MRQSVCKVLVAAGGVALVLAAGFLLDIDAFTGLWPYQTYGLSKVFIASLFAAVGAPVLWIGLSGELAAIRGGAGNLLVTGAGMAGWALWRVMSGAPSRVLWFALACLFVVVATALMIILSRRLEFRDTRPMPSLLRWSFAVFAVLLMVIGTLLILRVSHIMPWQLNADASVSYGFAFLGAAFYFAYGFARPLMGNAQGQLIGFLAYDLVLIWPYFQQMSTVTKQNQLSLTIYIAVLVYSGALAIYFLLLAPETKLQLVRSG